MKHRTLSRRKWLGLSHSDVVQELSELSTYAPVNSGLAAYTGTFGRSELLHLLKRTLFGVTKKDIDGFSGQTLAQVVDALLKVPVVLPSYPLNHYNSLASASGSPDESGVAWGEPWTDHLVPPLAPASLTDNESRTMSVKCWNMGLTVNQTACIHEKLVLFWHNHFALNVKEVQGAQRNFVYIKTLRENVDASLKDLCRMMTKDAAMLDYLNGQQNKKDSPDENFARELQELFTIGKELPLDQRYQERDVKAVARVLTGFYMSNANLYDAQQGFNVNNHDTGDKQFSSFYNYAVIKGSDTATAGDEELGHLLNMIFSTKTINGKTYSTADVIADNIIKKIYRFFVYYNIDETIQSTIIKPLADLYIASNFQLLPVLRKLLNSQHFFDVANRGCFIKMPLDVVVGLARTLGIAFDTTNVKQRYTQYHTLSEISKNLQQGYLEPPNVAGWPAFYQGPFYHEAWINSDTLPKRQAFAKLLISSGISVTYWGTTISLKLNAFEFAQRLTTPGDPNKLIVELNELLLGSALSDDHKLKIKTDFLLTGLLEDHYWSDAWEAATAKGATEAQKNIVIARFQKLLDYFVSIEEFQLT